jgi:hypothetical protein
MSRIKDFSARVFSGTVGYMIEVEGQVNCGRLEVQPSLNEKVPQGINPTILQLTCFPASDASPETFREASYSKNLDSQNQYTSVELYGNTDELLETLQVSEE